MKVLGIILGAMFLFFGACNGLQSLVEPRPQRATGGAVIALFFFVLGVVCLVSAARTRKADEDDERTRTCPFCAERIMPSATVCRFCPRDLPAA